MRRRWRGRIAANLALVAALGAGAAVVDITWAQGVVGAAPASSVPLGIYAGAANPNGVRQLAAATGSRPILAEDFLPGDSGWSGMDGAGGSLGWLFGPWRGSGYRLLLGVPILPRQDGNPVGSLAAGASGAYDAAFTTLAQNLVANGFGNAILRLGWEFDGGWETWSAQDPTSAAEFAGFFRQIVTTMRAVPGAQFAFDWNPAGGQYNSDVAAAYPGDAYVDYIGEDPYDQTWAQPQTPAAAWQAIVQSPYGLAWMTQFAYAHGKPVTLPEWGVTIRGDGHGLGDDPSFIDRVGAWAMTNHAAFVSYFNDDGSDGERHDLLDGDFPQSLAAFSQTFGAGGGPPPVLGAPPLASTAQASASAPVGTQTGASVVAPAAQALTTQPAPIQSVPPIPPTTLPAAVPSGSMSAPEAAASPPDAPAHSGATAPAESGLAGMMLPWEPPFLKTLQTREPVLASFMAPAAMLLGGGLVFLGYVVSHFDRHNDGGGHHRAGVAGVGGPAMTGAPDPPVLRR